MRIDFKLILLLFWLLAAYGSAQTFPARLYAEDDGIANALVYDVTQDTSGRLWFATRSGIMVYDGFDWQIVNRGLRILAYHAIRAAEDGSIYAASRSQNPPVSVYTGSQWAPMVTAPKGNFHSLHQGTFSLTKFNGKTTLAIGAEEELVLWDGSQWKVFGPREGMPATVNGIDAHGSQFIVATDAGILTVSPDELHHYTGLNLPTRAVMCISVQHVADATALGLTGAQIWLQGKDWLGYIKHGQFETVPTGKALPIGDRTDQSCLLPDEIGGLFLANKKGVAYFHPQHDQLLSLAGKNGFAVEGITSAFLDREKNIWFTSTSGVIKIPSLRFANFHREQGLLENEVTAILEPAPGQFLFGHNTGLTWYDGTRFDRLVLANATVPSTRVMDLRIGSNNTVWAAVDPLGLVRISNRQVIAVYDQRQGLEGNPLSVLEDQQGEVWVATNKGLFILRGERFDALTPEIDNFSIRRLVQGPDQSLLIATASRGLFVYDHKEKLHQYLVPGKEMANRLYAIHTDSRQRILIGTMDGVYQLDNGELTKVSFAGESVDQPVFFIIEDHDRQLWIGTDDGVIRWNGELLRRFSMADGLAGRETNRAAGYVDRRGRVWIGTDRGLSRYQKDFDRADIAPPLVELLATETAGAKYPPGSALGFAHDNNDLVFHYKGLSFINERALEYQVQLAGYDKDWLARYQVDRGQIRYTNLPPGSYRFQVRARNPYGDWSDIAESAEIVIMKPYWKSLWFTGLMLFLIVLAVYSAQRFFTQIRYASFLKNEVAERTRELNQKNEMLQQGLHRREKAELALQRELKEREKIEHDLQVAKEGAEAGSRAKSEFLATMSHEIRTPLNGVIGMTGLLQETCLSAEQRDYIETVRISGETLLTLIDDILDFSKLEAGKVILSSLPFAPRDCIEDAFDILATQAAAKNIELLYRIDPSVPDFVHGDANRVRQILTNLVGNAVKFTECGDVLVTLSYLVQPASEREAASQNLRFTVEDSGIGIPLEKLPSLFQPFFQVQTGTNAKYEGTGLGLVICDRLVSVMGGRIEVQSELGRGSTFSFTIAADPAPIPVGHAPSPPIDRLAGRHVLVAIANSHLKRAVETLCREWHMAVCTTTTPHETSREMNRADFAMAIVDEGVFAALQLDEADLQWEAPTLVLQTGPQARWQQTRLPVSTCLNKPLKPLQLAQALIKALPGGSNAAPAPVAAPKLDKTLAMRIPLRILVAEDNQINQKIALRMLSKMGYNADLAGNGLEVLAALENKTYDAIFMDIHMPEMDGLQAAREIACKLDTGLRPRIIAVTANIMEENRKRCREAGIDEFLSKPIILEEIQNSIERCFG